MARVPTDRPLRLWIQELIAKNNVAAFYAADEWKELRQAVLEFFHFECQECLKKGNYTKADCVHHVNEIRVRPDLALSRYYVGEKGQQQPNLVPLCNTCHNKIHDKLGEWQRKDKFQNVERW